MAMAEAVAKAFGLQGDAWQRHANPRVFPPPRSVDHWASRAVLGEKFWGARKEHPISVKIWFLDRIARLYDEMTLSAPGSPPPVG